MSPSGKRVLHLGAVYLGAAAVLAGFLFQLMVREHDAWLLRSYGNRWAFRDVPSKRGSICDRTGRVLVRDVPTTTLEVYYRQFRRGHPCGVAIHCVDTAARLVQGTPTYAYGHEGVLAAFRHCVYLPCSMLRPVGADREEVGDLRFYLVSLFAGLTDGASFYGRFRKLSAMLRARLEQPGDEPVCTALGLDPAALESVFRRRLDELRVVDTALAESGKDLWSALREARLSHEWRRVNDLREARGEAPLAWPYEGRGIARRSELVPFAVHRRLPYATAEFLQTRQEWHPGLTVRPSVDRFVADSTMVGGRLDSLRSLLGNVSYERGDAKDVERRVGILAEVHDEIEEVAEADPELTDEQRGVVRQRLTRAMHAALSGYGRVGRSGVEADLDPQLRGLAGMQWLLRRRGAREVGMWSSFDVTPGQDVRLSVDLRLQDLAERAIEEAVAEFATGPDAAFAVVDADTGEILAVVGRPTPAGRIARAEVDGKPVDMSEPALVWRSSGDVGSLAKPLILLEHLDALRDGRSAIPQAEFSPCAGSTPLPPKPRLFRYDLRCHAHAGDGRDCVGSLSVSCNSFFFQAAEGLGETGVMRAYARFGLLRTDPEGARARAPAFQAYVPGIPRKAYPDPAWRPKDLPRRAIGYGVSANVLQVVRAYAGLATGRVPDLSMVPLLPEQRRTVDLGVHPDDLNLVRQGMRQCVVEGTGKDLDFGELEVCAKTGTAEVGAVSRANNAWFAGYVVGRRRLAFACVVYRVPHGHYGAAAAGPMVARWLKMVREDPDLEREYLQR